MTTFESRERAFEAKYAHDEETRFLVTARRDKLFAHWLADRLHLPDGAHAALLKTILATPSGPGHDEAVIRMGRGAFPAQSAETDELHMVLNRCADQALEQFLAAPPPE
jgi:hypothetical protein